VLNNERPFLKLRLTHVQNVLCRSLKLRKIFNRKFLMERDAQLS
jgi:hypothetical protein